MRRWFSLSLALAAAACSDAPEQVLQPDEIDLSAAEAEAIALDTDLSAGVMIFDDLSPNGTSTAGTRSEPDPDALTGDPTDSGDGRGFARRRRCPEGGWKGVRGTVQRHEDEGVIVHDIGGRGTIVECRFRRGERLFELNGRFDLEAERRRVDGEPAGPQTTRVFGGFRWMVVETDRGGACRFDITSVRDPNAMTRVVEGTICGREFRRETSWNRDS